MFTFLLLAYCGILLNVSAAIQLNTQEFPDPPTSLYYGATPTGNVCSGQASFPVSDPGINFSDDFKEIKLSYLRMGQATTFIREEDLIIP